MIHCPSLRAAPSAMAPHNIDAACFDFLAGQRQALQQKTPGVSSGRFEMISCLSKLAGVELDDELLVDERIDFRTLRNAGHGRNHVFAIHFEPIHGWNRLGQIEHAKSELL